MRRLLLKFPAALALALAAAVPLAAALTFAPAQPFVGQAVTFTVTDPLTINTALGLNWDFGDNTTFSGNAVMTTHAYAAPGTYLVTVNYWAAGGQGVPVPRIGQATITVREGEATGARAVFRISFLQLRFEDGKGYRVLAKGERGLAAFAEVKVEGTGLLRWEWLVDGAVYRQEVRSLSFARTAVLDSGRVPGLPTAVPGLHEVTLRILDPRGDFNVPVIRYFVGAEPAAPEAAPAVTVAFTSAEGLDGKSMMTGPGTVLLPEGATCILRGVLVNGTQSAVALGLLRVTVDSRAIDLQIVRNLGPGESRAFLTSFQHAPGGSAGMPQTVFVSVYDIVDGKALLLSAKSLKVAR